jgi:hypothetical protein
MPSIPSMKLKRLVSQTRPTTAKHRRRWPERHLPHPEVQDLGKSDPPDRPCGRRELRERPPAGRNVPVVIEPADAGN